MSRPRQGEGIKRTIRRRGDKAYAYEITSRMENGKKVTVSKYIGRVDPGTNELIDDAKSINRGSKKDSARKKEISILENMEIGDYGGMYILDMIQRRIGLGDDLYGCFGDISRYLMAFSITLAQCNGSFNHVAGKLNRSWIRRYYDIPLKFDTGTVSSILERFASITNHDMNAFFSRRIGRSGGFVSWSRTYEVNGNGNPDDILFDERHRKVGLSVVSDRRGVPTMYRIHTEDTSNTGMPTSISKELRSRQVTDTIHVMNADTTTASDIACVMAEGCRVVLLAVSGDAISKRLMTQFLKSTDVTVETVGTERYHVWRTEVGVSSVTNQDGSGSHRLTLRGDEGHGNLFTMNAFVGFNERARRLDNEERERRIGKLIDISKSIDSDNPVRTFNAIAGDMRKFFDIRAEGRKVRVSLRKNAITFEANRAGLTVALTSEDVDWDTLVTSVISMTIGDMIVEHRGKEFNDMRPQDLGFMREVNLLRFIDLVLRCEMFAELLEKGLINEVSVGSMLSMADCITAMRYGSTAMLRGSESVDSTIFDSLGLSPPDVALEGVDIRDVDGGPIRMK